VHNEISLRICQFLILPYVSVAEAWNYWHKYHKDENGCKSKAIDDWLTPQKLFFTSLIFKSVFQLATLLRELTRHYEGTFSLISLVIQNKIQHRTTSRHITQCYRTWRWLARYFVSTDKKIWHWEFEGSLPPAITSTLSACWQCKSMVRITISEWAKSYCQLFPNYYIFTTHMSLMANKSHRRDSNPRPSS
jgi:hypothetical protein